MILGTQFFNSEDLTTTELALVTRIKILGISFLWSLSEIHSENNMIQISVLPQKVDLKSKKQNIDQYKYQNLSHIQTPNQLKIDTSDDPYLSRVSQWDPINDE